MSCDWLSFVPRFSGGCLLIRWFDLRLWAVETFPSPPSPSSPSSLDANKHHIRSSLLPWQHINGEQPSLRSRWHERTHRKQRHDGKTALTSRPVFVSTLSHKRGNYWKTEFNVETGVHAMIWSQRTLFDISGDTKTQKQPETQRGHNSDALTSNHLTTHLWNDSFYSTRISLVHEDMEQNSVSQSALLPESSSLRALCCWAEKLIYFVFYSQVLLLVFRSAWLSSATRWQREVLQLSSI